MNTLQANKQKFYTQIFIFARHINKHCLFKVLRFNDSHTLAIEIRHWLEFQCVCVCVCAVEFEFLESIWKKLVARIAKTK